MKRKSFLILTIVMILILTTILVLASCGEDRQENITDNGNDEENIQNDEDSQEDNGIDIVNPTDAFIFKELPDGTYSITGYDVTKSTESNNNLIIPGEYKGKKITRIGELAFFGCDQLTSINIPASVTSIREQAFLKCQALASITVDPANPKYRSEGNTIIDRETNTLVLGCNNSTIPASVTSIGKYAFSYLERLNNITIPNGVTSICEGAFQGANGLANLFIPASLTSINDYAFAPCRGIESITVDPKNTKYRSENNTLITKDTNKLILGCNNSIIPESVTSIGVYAFAGCTALRSITIHRNIESIDEYAFSYISGLESIVVDPNNAKYRGEGNAIIDRATNTLIAGCKNTIIPESVTMIGDSAFFSCGGLTSITIPSNVKELDCWAFRGCKDLTNVVFEGPVYIGSQAFTYCTNLRSITIPDGSVLHNGVFENCTSLTDVTLPNGLKYIDYTTFNECSSLVHINVPSSVEEIRDAAFAGCSQLKSIIIPSGVTKVGNVAFVACSNLTIYAEATSKPSGWDANWNPSDRPVVWGYEGNIDHTYTFVTNGGNAIADITAKGIIALPTPVKEGYTFDGWYDNAECNGKAVSMEYWNKSGATLYAKWVANA